jgi:hypothetical protein
MTTKEIRNKFANITPASLFQFILDSDTTTTEDLIDRLSSLDGDGIELCLIDFLRKIEMIDPASKKLFINIVLRCINGSKSDISLLLSTIRSNIHLLSTTKPLPFLILEEVYCAILTPEEMERLRELSRSRLYTEVEMSCIMGNTLEDAVTSVVGGENCHCGKQSIKFKCSGCNSTAYCSTECQRADWGRHKQTCSFFEKISEEFNSQIFCSACRVVSNNLSTCGNCKVIRYCSKKCQRSNWKMHKTFCEEIVRLQSKK